MLIHSNFIFLMSCLIFFLHFLAIPYFLKSGATIKACQEIGRHVLAFEDDALIYNALLAPLVAGRPQMAPPSRQNRPPPNEEPRVKKPRRNRFDCE